MLSYLRMSICGSRDPENSIASYPVSLTLRLLVTISAFVFPLLICASVLIGVLKASRLYSTFRIKKTRFKVNQTHKYLSDLINFKYSILPG